MQFATALVCSVVSALIPSQVVAARAASEVRLTNDVVAQLDVAKGGWHPIEWIAILFDRDETLRTRLGNPEHVRPLVLNRINREIINEFDRDDPRIVLDQTVVLSYSSSEQAEQALQLLRADLGVVFANRGALGSFSIVNDPLYRNSYANPGTLDLQRFQWPGLRLNLDDAWGKQQGFGYVGLVDNGIETTGLSGGGVHADLAFNYRPHFSYNFGFASNGIFNDGLGNPRHGGGTTVPSDLDENPYNSNGVNNIAGHGTHAAGIIAAQTNNSTGVAGVCQFCSLALGRVSVWTSALGGHLEPDSGHASSAVSWATNLGAQTINMSFNAVPSAFGCSGTPLNCPALEAANLHDVAVVAANGNLRDVVEFPASYPTAIAVAGTQWETSGGMSFWDGTGTFGSNRGAETDIAGPAVSILSSIYTGTTWNVGANCGDDFPSGYASGYGTCTGTSMAAPHIAGLIQLYRSTKPTAPLSEVKAELANNATACVGGLSANCGPGVPDAKRLVQAALGYPTAVNRTTPLFLFYAGNTSSGGGGTDPSSHFYSVFPQMGTAAILGTLLPKPISGSSISYWSYGPATPGYSAFPGLPIPCSGFSPPCSNRNPTALVSVLTSFRNPISGGPDLLRLTRWSYSCTSTPCSPSNDHVSFVYSTDVTENWPSRGYKRDGVEGYVYPPGMTQPRGTVALCRKYDSSRDDYVLFPGGGANGTSCVANTDGYTGGNYLSLSGYADSIGWVYPAKNPQSICNGGVPCASLAALPAILLDD